MKFQIIDIDEIEINKQTALGNKKHWHIYEIIAKKKGDCLCLGKEKMEKN